ncbi:MAG TPA: tetratricopeptide repeat protein [Ignavibacteria bacterium]|nr:tetratricopeptide repeat protein [Ignavibacteria bacterium]
MENNLPEINSLWDYSNPAETEKKFTALLSEAEKSGDKDYLVQLITQIARTQGLQMKFDEAHKTLDKALKMLDTDTQLGEVRYMLERGRVYNSSKHSDEARKFFIEAYQKAMERGFDSYAVDAAHMMGIVEKGDESLKWNEIAIKDAEESKDEKARNWLGSLYNNTAWTYFDMKNLDKAMELHQKNVEWHSQKGSVKETLIARWSVARILREMGKYQEALNAQMKLMEETEGKKLKEDGYGYEEIAENLYLLGRIEESKPYFKKAYDLLSKDIWLAEYEKDRLDRLNKMSQ